MNRFTCMKVTLFIFVLLLTACGAQNKETDPVYATPASAIKKEEGESTVDEKEKRDEVIRILEQNINYSMNGQFIKETAFLKYNDNQHYSLYVLPQFEMAAEEPHKDVVFLVNDDRVFMRIEILPNTLNWKELEESTRAQLSVLNDEIISLEPPTDVFFQNAIILETKKDEEIITAILIRNQQLYAKLTMFTRTTEDYRDAFRQMAKTIINE